MISENQPSIRKKNIPNPTLFIPRLIQFTYFLGPGVKVHQSQTLKGNPVAPRPTFTATHTMVSTHWDTAPKFNMENLWSYGHDQVLKIIVETPLNWDRT